MFKVSREWGLHCIGSYIDIILPYFLLTTNKFLSKFLYASVVKVVIIVSTSIHMNCSTT